jgi:hypothetical protein
VFCIVLVFITLAFLSDEDGPEEYSPGVPMSDLEALDILPTLLTKPPKSTSWIWKYARRPVSRCHSVAEENKRREELDDPIDPVLRSAPHHHRHDWLCLHCVAAGKNTIWRKYTSPGAAATHLTNGHGLTDVTTNHKNLFGPTPSQKTTFEDIDSAVMMAMARDNMYPSPHSHPD